jgi:cell division protein FtsB|nr:MAG TPA: Putative transcription factor-coil, transcription.03A [Caudoviricetes sp.]
MTLTERIDSVNAQINATKAKLQQLADMQDQMIAEHNKLVGKLEALTELADEQAEKAQPTEGQADEKDNNN